MKKKVLFVFFLFFLSMKEKNLPIYFNLYYNGESIENPRRINKWKSIYDGYERFHYKLIDLFGTSEFYVMRNSDTTQSGSFLGTNNIDSVQVHSFDDSLNLIISYQKYYIPRRNGIWKVYKANGELDIIQVWENGLLKKEKNTF